MCQELAGRMEVTSLRLSTVIGPYIDNYATFPPKFLSSRTERPRSPCGAGGPPREPTVPLQPPRPSIFILREQFLMFVTDWPLMFGAGLFFAFIALWKQRGKFWFLTGLLISILSVLIVIYLYLRWPEFVLTALGISPDEVSVNLLVLFYLLYPLLYTFGFMLGFYPLRNKLSRLALRLQRS
jgi:hypothetical protein